MESFGRQVPGGLRGVRGDEMKITSRFTVAVHAMLAILALGGECKMTSDFIASSVNVNPVVIRRTLLRLKAAGLVEVRAGSGGARLAREAGEITLYDVYRAVDSVEGSLFNFHDQPNPQCPVGRNIHAVLDGHLLAAQAAMEDELKSVTLADLQGQLEALE